MNQLTNFIPKTVEECNELLGALNQKRDGTMITDRYGKLGVLNAEEVKALIGLIEGQIGANAEVESDGQGVSTDKGPLFWLGKEDLKDGTEVFVDSENGEGLVAAPDGEYVTEKGTTITVTEGVVSSIKRPAAKKSNKKKEQKDENR